MSERIRGSYDDSLYKSTYTLLYSIVLCDIVSASALERVKLCKLMEAKDIYVLQKALSLVVKGFGVRGGK